MKDEKQEQEKKIKKRGAIIAGIVIILMVLIQLLSYLWGFTQDMPPIWIAIIFLSIPVLIIVGIVFSMHERLKEIEGGEEDEASKY